MGLGAKLLVFAHVPPPEHGQSRMVASMLEGLEEGGVEVTHVDARVSEEMSDLGSGLLGKMRLMVGYLRQALAARWRGGATTLYYVPGPVIWSAVVRDWIVMLVLRPWYTDLILHWHAIGQGEWAHGSERCRLPGPRLLDRIARTISAFFLRQPDLSIVVSPTSDRDARAVCSSRVEVVCNGIPDPCPEFESTISLARIDRAKEIGDAADSEIRVLFMSHGTVEKGLFDALRAVELAVGKLGGGLRVSMTVAGGVAGAVESRFGEEFERLNGDRGLPLTIQRKGFVSGPEKAACFQGADLFIAASRWESFGLTVLEAMAWGVPVVAAASDGVKGVLSDEHRWMAPTASPERLAEELLKGLESLRRGEGAIEGQELRHRFLAGYRSECFTRRIQEVLECRCDSVGEI